ncbi:MFS monosaccharide transporter-like protein [Ophiobolus disseminans]|uniref:MFS monosaccharide transporter-like protein n=1 Tax=Ophiobolus disseminans TaxID=1469910 RepID=A0A6A6ZEN7_9PLEO|nr:MFS monosaccharide transporter-like protein [Ophiobolus disseminans]
MPAATNGLLENWKCILACTLVSMSPFQYGIDFGAIGGLQAMKGFLQVFGNENPNVPGGWNLSAERQQLISSLMTLGAFLSSSSAGSFATKMGRRQCLWMASALCCVANVVMMSTTSLAGLYAGRLLIGIANGWYMTFSQLYIQESAPARYRGLLISVFQIWTSIGSLIGTVIDNATHNMAGKVSYLIPLGTIYIIPVFISIGLFFIPESPRWLMLMDKQDQARKSMLWMRPDPATVPEELAEIQAAIDIEKQTKATANFMDIWRDPVDRRRTLLAIAAVSTQAASGAMFMIAYGTYFFQMANVGSPFMNSCILTAVGVLAIIVNSCVISKIGRRRVFLMSGLSICGVCQIVVAAVSHVNPGTVSTGKAIVGLSIIYICGYNGMIAAYAWLSGGEIPSQRLRSYTFGVAAAVGFAGAWLATFTAPYFINPEALNWGPEYGWIWGPSCFLTVVWVYFFLPEIKNRTLEEIDEMFEAKLPARQFRKYVCMGRQAAGADEKVVRRSLSASEKGGVVEREVVGGKVG